MPSPFPENFIVRQLAGLRQAGAPPPLLAREERLLRAGFEARAALNHLIQALRDERDERLV